MSPQAKSTPKDVFLHFLSIIVLIISIISFIALWFQYINVQFPEKISYFGDVSLEAVRMSSSALLVVWPVYILVAWLIGRDLKQDHAKREIKVRKWLTYLTLFIAAIAIIIDLITLIYNFYSGELTVRFILKIITVLIVAGGVFGYFTWDNRRTDQETSHVPKKLAVAISLVILFSLILGFFVIGSPAKQRAIRFDQERISDLSTIQYQIADYYRQKETLPNELNDLTKSLYVGEIANDPDTGEAYEYVKTGDLTFELCATFATDSKNLPPAFTSVSEAYDRGIIDSQNWEHRSGRHCFERTIDPDFILSKDNIMPVVR